jgi:hypothetical protein
MLTHLLITGATNTVGDTASGVGKTAGDTVGNAGKTLGDTVGGLTVCKTFLSPSLSLLFSRAIG